jgi:hypothetical protein
MRAAQPRGQRGAAAHLLRAEGDDARGGQDLGGQEAGNAQHGPAAVDDLAVGQPLGGDEAARALGVAQAQGVEAKVCGGTGEPGAQ